MARQQSSFAGFIRIVKKLSLSAFVLISFIGYVISQRLANLQTSVTSTVTQQTGSQGNAPVTSSSPAQQMTSGSSTLPQLPNTQTQNTQAQTVQTQPTAVPVLPTQATAGQYKDGTYTG